MLAVCGYRVDRWGNDKSKLQVKEPDGRLGGGRMFEAYMYVI